MLVATGLAAVALITSTAAGASSPPVTTITLQAKQSYTPKAPPGATDDYHCTLVNPHVTSNSFIVASHFYPNSIEVHHAILFLVPPDLAAAAEAADQGGKGWTCFGESALPNTVASAQISNTPWLTRLGAGPRQGRRTGRDRGQVPGREPGGHADPLQPLARRQAGAGQAQAVHGAGLHRRSSRSTST